ncbi:MAG: helix-turn-helix transcriptional regulator [Rhizobiaceae bacterium]
MTKSANKTGFISRRLPCENKSGGSDGFDNDKLKSALSGFRSLQFQPTAHASNNAIGVERIANTDCEQTVVHTSDVQMIRGPGIDRFAACISVSLNGEHELRTEEKTVRVREGDVGISSGQGADIYSRGEGVHKLLLLPAIAADDLPQMTTGPVVVPHDSPVAVVLRKIMATLEQELGEDSGRQSGTIAKIAMNVVSLLIVENEKNPKDDGPALLRARVRSFVEENIGAPDLSVTQIAHSMNVSRATLYRFFSGIGGVRKFVTQIRLDTARKMLEAGSLRRGHILHVAYRCGFSSPGAFSRAFKLRYGISPGEYCRKHVDQLGRQGG